MPYIDIEDISKCAGRVVSLDTETNGLLWYREHIIGLAVHCPSADIHGYIDARDERIRDAVYDAVNDLPKDTTVIMHNAKFDFHMLNLQPRKFEQIIDTTVLIHLLDSRYKKGLVSAEQIFLGDSSKRAYVTAAPYRKKIWEWPEELRMQYACNDVLVTYQLAEVLTPKVVNLNLWHIFQKDMEYLKDLWDIERRGILTDPNYLHEAIKAQSRTLEDLERTLYDSIGYEFNWKSPQQLSVALYDNLGIPKPKNPFAGADGIDRSRFADAGLYKSTCTSTFLLTEKVKHPLGTLVFALRESFRMWKTMYKYLMKKM